MLVKCESGAGIAVEDDGSLRFVTASGPVAHLIEAVRLPADTGIAGFCIKRQVSLVVRDPHSDYAPVAFGPLGRGWPLRARFGGTYDDKWLKDDFPFLPKDFDERYYQAAPEDQQIKMRYYRVWFRDRRRPSRGDPGPQIPELAEQQAAARG